MNTAMQSGQIKSEYNESPYPWDRCYDSTRKQQGARFKIKRRTKSPIYDVDRVKSLSMDKSKILLSRNGSRRCSRYGINLSVLSGILSTSLNVNLYKDSEWCRLNKDDEWYASDAYDLPDIRYISYADCIEKLINLYVKLSITMNQEICTISCHS